MTSTPADQLIQRLFQRAVRAYEAGDRSGAVSLAEAVLARQGNHVGALYLMGKAAIDNNQAGDALPYLEAALRLDSRHPGIQRALGLAYLGLERWAEAAGIMRLALERDPHDSGLLNNLGIAYKELGHTEAAIQCYRAALVTNPNDPNVYNNLGNALDKQRQYDAAIEVYSRALALDKQNPSLDSNLAILLERGNRIGEAEARVAHGLGHDPNHAGLNLTAAKCARRRGHSTDAIGRLEDILRRTCPGIAARRAIEFELGRNYDVVGDYDSAFRHFQIANQLTVKAWPNSLNEANKFIGELEQLLECFSADWVETWIARTRPRQQPDSYPLTFMVGFLRTGSTLIDTLLGSQPGVVVLEEEVCLENTLNSLRQAVPPYPQVVANLDTRNWDSLRADYWQSVSQCLPTAVHCRQLVDKNPLMSAHAGYIHALFPDARFLFTLRHPCDVILSCYMQTFDGSSVRASFQDLESSARIYGRVMQLWLRYREIFDLQVCELRYESLVTNPRSVLQTALGFIGIEEPAQTDGEPSGKPLRGRVYTPSYAQVVEPINTRSVGRWQHYLPYFGKAEADLRPWIDRFGYSA